MTDLPKGWSESPLGALVRPLYGKALVGSNRAAGPVPVYGSAGALGFHDAALTEGPTIIVGRKGNAGAVHLSRGSCWPIDTTYYFPVPEIIEPKFLQFQIHRANLRGLNSSTAVPSLRRNDLESVRILLAPLDEQRRVVAVIEEQFSRLDAAEASLRRTLRNARRLAAAAGVLITGVKGGERKIGEIGDVVTGSTPSTKEPSYWGDFIPFITPGDLRHANNVRSGKRSLSERGMRAGRPVPAGSVLVTCIGATIGKASLIEIDCVTNQQINAIVPDTSSVMPQYLLAVISAPEFQRGIHERASSTTLPILSKRKFSELRLTVPPLSDQQCLLREYARHTSLQQDAEALVERVLLRSAQLRSGILMRAFSGHLVPQDPNDEPVASRSAQEGRNRRHRAGRGEPSETVADAEAAVL